MIEKFENIIEKNREVFAFGFLFILIFSLARFALGGKNVNLAAVSMSNPNSVFLRTPNTGYCNIISASNTTPIKITVSNINDCGIKNNGQVVLISEVVGNTSANIHVKNPSDRANLARQVYNISGNSFDIKDLNDNPVSGNGTYINGGRVGLATLYTLKDHPRLYLDGSSGSITSSVSNKSASGRANPSNVAYVALKNSVNNFNSNYGELWGSDRSGNLTLASALRWLADLDNTSKNSALFGIKNITQILGTPACDEGQRYCYAPASSVADYPTQYMENFSQAYSIMRGQMTASEKSNFLNFVLSDLPWTKGGQGYTDTNKIKPTFKVSDKNTSGTVSVSNGSNVVSGVGTSFTKNVSVGDIIVIPHSTENVYAQGYIVKEILNDTSLKIESSMSGNITNQHYMVGPAWNDSMYGFLWFSKHYEIGMLCGGAGDVFSSVNIDCTSNYGVTDGIYQGAGDHNLWLARLLGYYSIGLATCGDDVRGCLLLSLANELFTDVALPRALTIWTGFSQSNPGYHVGRMYNIILSISTMTKNSFVEKLDYLNGTDIAKKGLLWGIAGQMPYLDGYGDIYLSNAEGNIYYVSANNLRSALISMFDSPNTNEARYYKYWISNILPYNESFIRYNRGEYVWWHFLWNDPTIEPMTSPTTIHFNNTNSEKCISIFGLSKCPTNEGKYFSISNQSWQNDRTYLAFNASSYKCLDHCGDDIGGWFVLAKNKKVLYAGDSSNFMGGKENRPYLEIGGSHNNLKSYPETGPIYINWTAGDDKYMVSSVDLSGAYKSGAGVSFANKQMIHLKGGTEDYIIDYVKVKTNSSTSIKGLQHFYLNGCGSPSSSSCINLSRTNLTASNIQTGVKLLTKFIGFNGNILLQTDNNSDTNGSYSGGQGKTFRFYVCPKGSGTNCTNSSSLEYVSVHKPTTDSSFVMPEIYSTENNNFKIVEIKDVSNPKVVVLASNDNLGDKVTFRTTHQGSAQYVMSGLKPLNYIVLRDGKEIYSYRVLNKENSLYFESTSGLIQLYERGQTPSLPANDSSQNVQIEDNQNTATSASGSTEGQNNNQTNVSVNTNTNNNNQSSSDQNSNQSNNSQNQNNSSGGNANNTESNQNINNNQNTNTQQSNQSQNNTNQNQLNNEQEVVSNKPNKRPEVDAGKKIEIEVDQSVSLSPKVIDDGLPSSSLNYKWSIEKASGQVIFSSINELNPKVTFRAPGQYILILKVSDGELFAEDDLAIDVSGKLSKESNQTPSLDPVVIKTESEQKDENSIKNVKNQTIQSAVSNKTSIQRNLSRGSNGDDVLVLQKFLVNQGFLKNVTPNGVFGPATEKALQRFQSKNNIVYAGKPSTTGYGMTGPKTRRLINRILGN